MNHFTNPYTKQDGRNQIVSRISTADWRLLACIRPGQGTFTTVINILVKRLCEGLRERGITDITRVDDFERFVAGCTVGEPNGEVTLTKERYIQYQQAEEELNKLRNERTKKRTKPDAA